MNDQILENVNILVLTDKNSKLSWISIIWG